MCKQVILDSSFALHGFSPYVGREERRVQGLDYVAVRLFSNRSQMTSKCGKNKKVAHEAIAECITDVLTTF